MSDDRRSPNDENDQVAFGIVLQENGDLQVASQVEPLRKLMEVRKQLTALLDKTDGKRGLENELAKIIRSKDLQQQIAKDAGVGKGEEGPGKGGA